MGLSRTVHCGCLHGAAHIVSDRAGTRAVHRENPPHCMRTLTLPGRLAGVIPRSMQIEYPSKLAEMAAKADVEAVKTLLAGAR